MSWNFGQKQVLVYGLGLSGLGTVKALLADGCDVLAWDARAEQRDAATSLGATCLPEDALDWTNIAAVILSPGIPLTHPEPHDVVKAAKAHHVDVMGDVELFCRQNRAGKVIAITGTNGKSTTTALIAHILQQAGRKAAMGGNIGVPVLDLDEMDFYVLELSSYQIDLCPSMQADIAVLLNISPDHLDRHGGMDGYRAVKKKLLAQQDDGAVAVIGADAADQVQASTSLSHLDLQLVEDTQITDDLLHIDGKDIVDLATCPNLQGAHNGQNAAAAYMVCRAAGLSDAEIAAGLQSFAGLAHRMEQVGLIDDVRFVNDSKATNAEAAAPALKTYQKIYWILGGQAKAGGIDALEPLLDHVSRAYVIGAAAEEFALFLSSKGKGVMQCGTLQKAVKSAFEDATSDKVRNPVVLLSPACASWDQFTSFEHRGDMFRDTVEALRAEHEGRAA